MQDIRIEQRIKIGASAEMLFALIVDPQTYVAIEPRLHSARWLDDGVVRRGARAAVVTNIPFTLALVRALIGAPAGVITVTEWSPTDRLACEFRGATVVGELEVLIEPEGRASILHLNGSVAPRRTSVKWLLRPMRRQLEGLVARSIERGAKRLEWGLRDPSGAPAS